MRRVNSIEDVQIVLNDLLNFKNRIDSGGLNPKGNPLRNVGAGKSDSDVVILEQIKNLANKSDIPTTLTRNQFRTILWSTQFSPVAGDIMPPYCIVTPDLAGTPMQVWVAAATNGTKETDNEGLVKKLKINVAIQTIVTSTVTDEDGNISEVTEVKQTSILNNDLELAFDEYGPNRTSDFISHVPSFGVGSFIIPIIDEATSHSAVTIGVVLRRQRTDRLGFTK